MCALSASTINFPLLFRWLFLLHCAHNTFPFPQRRGASSKRKREDEYNSLERVVQADDDQMAVDDLEGVDFDLDDLDDEMIDKIVSEAPEVWISSPRFINTGS